MSDELMTHRQVEEYFHAHRATIDRWRKHRGFPQPIEFIGSQIKRFRRAEVEQWLANAQLMMSLRFAAPRSAALQHETPVKSP